MLAVGELGSCIDWVTNRPNRLQRGRGYIAELYTPHRLVQATAALGTTPYNLVLSRQWLQEHQQKHQQ